MNVVASPDVEPFVRDHGGRLFVWTDAHRCCGGGMTYLLTSAVPKQDRSFARIDTVGFELWFDAGRFPPPQELQLGIKGRRRAHVAAYWDGCVFVT